MAKRNQNMRLRVEGADGIVQAMRRADKETEKALNDLVSEAIEIVFREADARAPIGSTSRVRNSLRIETGKDNKGMFFANVVVGKREGEKTDTSGFYVTFYELGSSRQPPRPFMRPALDKSKYRVRKYLIDGLRRVILKDRGI